MKTGLVCQIIECPKCLRVLDPTSSLDCPDHPMPCCGGKGTEHALGCEADPMRQAGRRWAVELERAILAAFLGTNPDGTTDAPPECGKAQP